MRFTTYQYDRAIQALNDAKEQLEPDSRCCSVCGDGGHQSFECGHNPLVAMALCEIISHDADEKHQEAHNKGKPKSPELHALLHYLAGYDFSMGEQLGPRRIVLPPESEEQAARLLNGLSSR